jgi:uncharacterized protein YyaL (SSP411 family)
VLHTLDALAAGGIRDHLGGGFHRYSTDAKWLVPHFEIMLYDNAMLAYCYAEAYHQTGELRYQSVANAIFQFVRNRMRSASGAFFTAFDAEVDGREGLNYLWTPQQVEEVLGGEDAKLFNRAYGLDRGPNFADPHHGSGTPDSNVLFVAQADGLSDTERSRLGEMRRKLLAARDRRKQPLLDTKILTSWNALMIRALAYAGRVFNERNLIELAANAADFLLRHHRREDGTLMRASRDGVVKYEGFLDDYAFMAQALLELHHAGDTRQPWLDHARSIVETMRDKFGGDGDSGGFYTTDRRSTDMIVRQKTAGDSPLPSGNSVAAMVLLQLGDADAARGTIAAFAQQLRHNGEGMSSMAQAVLLYLGQGGEPFTVSAETSVNAEGGIAQRPKSPQQSAEAAVDLDALWQSPTELHVQLSIAAGYHINHHEPATLGDVPLVATRLNLESAGAPVAAVEYPQAIERTLPFADAPLRMYEGDVMIIVRFASPPQQADELSFALTFQPCDDTACLPPVTRRFRVTRHA